MQKTEQEEENQPKMQRKSEKHSTMEIIEY